MKRLELLFVAIVCLITTAQAQTNVTVKIQGIRSNNGMIMVMGETGKNSPTAYAMVKAEKGSTTVMLKDLKGKKVSISLYHDENGNKQLEKGLFGRPTEGYALKSVKIEGKKEVSCDMTLYYPDEEK